jgi:glycosyltransferase involved in cell wall biosynthesis
MNILHTEASTGWGGQDMRVLLEAQQMAARGHKVLLACARDCPLWNAAHKEPRGVQLVPLYFGRKLNRVAVRAVREIIRRENIEIVNTHSSGDGWSGAVATWLEKRSRRGLPLHVRSRHLSHGVKNNAANKVLYGALTDFIITTGEALRETLLRENEFPSDKVLSIPTGVDTKYFDPSRWPRETFRKEIGATEGEWVWGMVAMIRRMKGHIVLAEAAALLLRQQPQVRLAIVGDIPSQSPVRDEFETRLRELDIFERFSFTGYREDVANVLAGCDAIVLPSIEGEGVPQSLAQALAMKKPVVSTQVGGIGEIVRAGDTGWLVPPHDAEALAHAMNEAMTQPEEAQLRAANGQQLIYRDYSVEAMTDRVEALYECLLKSHRERTTA